MAVHGGGYLPGYSGRIDSRLGVRAGNSHGRPSIAADDLSAAGLSPTPWFSPITRLGVT